MSVATDTLPDRVRAMLRQQQLFAPHWLLVVAVSGGPDSLALLHMLWQLQEAGGPGLHVAHLDHSFRGEQSANEARFVAQTASAWGIPATIEQYNVPAFAAMHHQNKQAAARSVRYTFLARVAQQVGAHAVAVAHHADDQAETVLLHLLRGAGPAGLRGMRAVVPWQEWAAQGTAPASLAPVCCPTPAAPELLPVLLRPLLDTTRSEIEHYCTDQHLTPQYDPSNTATTYTRNRLRTDLLPHLTDYNPHIVAALGRTAQVCANDYAYIQAQLDALWPDLVDARTTRVIFRAAQWDALPTALQRYALRRAAAHLVEGDDDLGYEQVEAGRTAAAQQPGYTQMLGRGLMLVVEHDSFVLIQSRTDSATDHQRSDPTVPQLATAELVLNVPGITYISGEWYAEARDRPPPHLPDTAAHCWWVALDADTLDGPLLLRCRRAGDRFRPAGGRGSRLLQDFFVDQKVPRDLRAAWPLLATASSIVWIAGLRADARFHATARTQHTLWIGLYRHLPRQMEEEDEVRNADS